MASLRAPFMPQPTIPGQEEFIRAEAKRLEEQGRHLAQGVRKLLAPLKDRACFVLHSFSLIGYNPLAFTESLWNPWRIEFSSLMTIRK